uniref:Uncharacterized protein n=1 Tax=Kalanchoe fedtschenkoi TaxID=63787 RepID=A0A7N0UKQ5_KALFE
MSGVWMFKQNGVISLVEHPSMVNGGGGGRKTKLLVHLPSGEIVKSYAELERILRGLGWEWYYGGDGQDEFYQFHRKSSIDLISLPKDFSKFNSIYMYDLVVKNPNVFLVKDCYMEY